MKPLNDAVQNAQLRLRSITAGCSETCDELTFEDQADVLIIRRSTPSGGVRSQTFLFRHLVILARLESDHPARAPIAPTPLHVPPNSRGATFDPAKDEVRLNEQLKAVLAVMQDGKRRTLAELRADLRFPALARVSEAGLSARIRDLRKPQFGGHTVERERVPETRGLWRYRLVS